MTIFVYTHNDKRMLCRSQYTVFGQRMFHLIFLYNHIFFQHFDGIQCSGGFFTAQNDFAKGTFAQHFQEFEIFQCLRDKYNDSKKYINMRLKYKKSQFLSCDKNRVVWRRNFAESHKS